MKAHKIEKPAEQTYGIACDPLNNIYHEFVVEPNQVMQTGQPVVVFGPTREGVRKRLFSAEDQDIAVGAVSTKTPLETTISVDYTEADALQTCEDVMSITAGVMVRPIKHPDRDEWAMHVSTEIIASATAGAKKDALLAKHLDKINNGKNKTKPEAKADNWHKKD